MFIDKPKINSKNNVSIESTSNYPNKERAVSQYILQIRTGSTISDVGFLYESLDSDILRSATKFTQNINFELHNKMRISISIYYNFDLFEPYRLADKSLILTRNLDWCGKASPWLISLTIIESNVYQKTLDLFTHSDNV